MNRTAIVGVFLILLGVIALAYRGFSYTKREKVLDLGPIQATAETRERVPIPPVVAGVAVAGGVVLVVLGARGKP
jgi:hypothetical protein